MGNCAFTNVSDDFHVAVRVFRETGTGFDHIVVPDPQLAPVHAFWIVIVSEREVVMCVQPAVVGAAQCVERS